MVYSYNLGYRVKCPRSQKEPGKDQTTSVPASSNDPFSFKKQTGSLDNVMNWPNSFKKILSSPRKELDSIMKEPRPERTLEPDDVRKVSRPPIETDRYQSQAIHHFKARSAFKHQFVLAMVLATVYFNIPLPMAKMINAIIPNAVDINQPEHIINCTLIYHLFSIIVAGSDWYPLWLRRHGYLATRFRAFIGLYIALRCCLGGHRWILIAFTGCLFHYFDGHERCCREIIEPITDAPHKGTDVHRALRELPTSASGQNNELVIDSSCTGKDAYNAYNAPRESAKSACEEDDEPIPDALLPGTDAYRVLYESIRSACMKDSNWIIKIFKDSLDSVRSYYEKLFEELIQDSVKYIRGKSYSLTPSLRHEASITALGSRDIKRCSNAFTMTLQ